MVDPTPLAGRDGAYAAALSRGMLENASLSGYSWYRAADLAIAKEVRTLQVSGSSTTSAGMYSASYATTIMTTFEPALNVWSFPLQANESWNATGNATVQGWVTWQLVGPSGSFAGKANFSYTVPVRLFLMSGPSEDVSTPAGTFAAIPVSMGRPELDVTHAGMATDPPETAMGLDHEMPVERHHAAQAWYSGTVKNVVQMQLFAAGMRLNLVLSSYHLS
jgi:hypothetical protein